MTTQPNQFTITNNEIVNLHVEMLKEELKNKLTKLYEENDTLIDSISNYILDNIIKKGNIIKKERQKYINAYLKLMSFKYPDENISIIIEKKVSSFERSEHIPYFYFAYQGYVIEVKKDKMSVKCMLRVISKNKSPEELQEDLPFFRSVLYFTVEISVPPEYKKLEENRRERQNINSILSKEADMYKKILAKATMVAIKNDEEINKLFGNITKQDILLT